MLPEAVAGGALGEVWHRQLDVLVLRLSIDARDDGTWDLQLGTPERQSVRATIPRAEVEQLLLAVAEPPPLPVVVLPSSEAQLRAHEEALGGRLACLIRDDAQLVRELGEGLGAARARGASLLLVIDTYDAVVQALPWELLPTGLAADVPIEIARLGRGPGCAPRRPGLLQVLVWCPDADDPTMAELLAHLQALAAELNTPIRSLEQASPEAMAGRVVLYTLCHGQRIDDLLVLREGGAGFGSGTAVDRIAHVLRDVDLVVCAICGGGAPEPGASRALPERMLAAGASSCVAPVGTLGLDAAQAFISGVQRSLAAGGSSLSAVARGRREVGAMGLPALDARAHRLVWSIADLSTSELVSGLTGWLGGAHARAVEHRGGFLGVEHLVLAVDDAPAHGDGARLAYQLANLRLVVSQRLRWLVPAGRLPETIALSPRLSALLARSGTPSDDELVDWFRDDAAGVLWSWADPPLAVRDLEGSVTLSPTDVQVEGGEPGGLEVLGGPEDGRVIVLAPGETLGRSASPARSDHVLYEGTFLVDRGVSRTHIEWHRGGIVALSPVSLWSATGHQANTTGLLPLSVGDVIELGRATRLRVVASEP